MILDDIAMFELLPFDNILSFLVFHFISVRLLRSTHFKSIPIVFSYNYIRLSFSPTNKIAFTGKRQYLYCSYNGSLIAKLI